MTIGGGFKAVRSVFHYTRQIGPRKLWAALHSKNACKACALGTGGQNGGTHNETHRGVEFCNKNVQAHLSDHRPAIPNTFFLEHSIEMLSQYSGKALEDLGRLTTPLYKNSGDTHYSPIRYEEAIAKIADRLSNTEPNRSFFYASGRSSNEATYLLQLMARLYGTNNINNCSYYCHQASGVALNDQLGTGTATVEFADLDHTDLVFVFGANPASNHPRFVKALLQVRRRGGHVIVVNPIKEAGLVKFASPSDWRSMIKGGESVASLYVQPHLGGDIALINGIAKCLLDNDQHAINDTFIAEHTEDFSAYQQSIQALQWQEIERQSGLSQNEIERVAEYYAGSNNTIFTWSMGLTHHHHGVQNIQCLTNLALLRGMIGKPGAGLLPLRGHSNIQGTGSMGFTPKLKQLTELALQQRLGQPLPSAEGLDTMACMNASERGEMDVAFMLGGNLLASNPDFHRAAHALDQIPFKVFINPSMNMSHFHGVSEEAIILPIRTRDEEQQRTTQESMFNFVRLSDGGIQRHPQLLSEVDIITAIGTLLIPKEVLDFQLMGDHKTVRQWISKTVPGFQKLAQIDESKQEFHIDGRILHTPQFATATGKAHFRVHAFERKEAASLMLTTIRSEGQFNSIIYHEHDAYRDQSRRDVLLMHPQDLHKHGVKANQKVTVHSATGKLTNIIVRPFDIRPGNAAMYYPEANVLVSSQVDPQSKTPGFKSTPITIEPA